MNKDGYIQVLDPRKHTGCRYSMEHRLVIANHLGRDLLPTEVVHHMNGIRHDNRLGNLCLLAPGAKHESQTLIKALQARIRVLEAAAQRGYSAELALADIV